jgi:hypothetical protein
MHDRIITLFLNFVVSTTGVWCLPLTTVKISILREDMSIVAVPVSP